MKSINSEAELDNLIKNYDRIIIFGAGLVANVFVKHLFDTINDKEKVFCIAVTRREKNPGMILGLPVCTLDSLSQYRDALVVIATLENSHKEIEELLKRNYFHNIAAISNTLYACLRKRNPDYCCEVLQNTQTMKLQLKSILKSQNQLFRLQYKLEQLERCIQYGARTYQETLTPQEYAEELKKWYWYVTGKELDLENPRTYNEKIQWIKLYGTTPLMTMLSDKWAVREWVSNRIGEKYLIPILGVWERFDEIPFDELPNEFVLKCTHGSGWNMIVRDKTKFDRDNAKKHFDSWMNLNFAFISGLELQYRDIHPRIIAERYLKNTKKDLFDYKFWCFQGRVEFIMFLSERDKILKMNNYDREWNLLPFVYGHKNCDKPVEKPEKLEDMIEIAEKLAQGFEHVRVDLYQLNDGTIKFGEMTFTSASGTCSWNQEEINNRLGALINIDRIKNQNEISCL